MGGMVFAGGAVAVVGAVSRSVIHWAGLILQGKQGGIGDVWELFWKQEELEWKTDWWIVNNSNMGPAQ